MGKETSIRKEDLTVHGNPRVPVCLVLDRSPSMSGDTSCGSLVQQTNPRPIDELNKGVKAFFDNIKNDEIAAYAAEVAVVAFSDEVVTLLDFESITRVEGPIVELDMEKGGTSIGRGVSRALELLERRKEEYKEAGVDYFQPWLVLMTDGQPTDDTHLEVADEVSKQVMAKRLTVFPIGIGDGADMEVLSMFSPNRDPLKLKGLGFKDFFKWLGDSVNLVSQSTPGETIPLNTEGIKGWAEL